MNCPICEKQHPGKCPRGCTINYIPKVLAAIVGGNTNCTIAKKCVKPHAL